MFLKTHKYLAWLICACAALCLSLGITICDYQSEHNGENIYETSYSASETEELQRLLNHRDTEDEKQKAAVRFFGIFLIATGIVLAFVFIFGTRQMKPFLGTELELTGVFLALVLFYKSNLMFGLWLLFRWLLLLFVLVCLRSLRTWCAKKFPMAQTTAYRLGMRAAGFKKVQSRYLIFQFLWSIVLLVAAVAFFILTRFNGQWWMMAVICLISVMISGVCIYQAMKALNHLTEQIDKVYQGSAGTVCQGIFTDNEKQLIELLKQRDAAIEKAVVSERFKVELISNVSHDLRTPLTAILGYGELLEKEKLSEEGKAQLRRLNEKAGYMRELVEALFELTKVSSGAETCHMDKLDIIRLLEQTLGLFDDQLNNADILVRRHYDTDRLMVVTDGSRMHQVFANLVGNAIKYTLPGTRIHLSVKTSEDECVIRMTNISSYEMDFDPEEIVQRFARGDKARSTRGSGLGLAIAQTYTESVDGNFHVEIDGEQFSAVVKLPI